MLGSPIRPQPKGRLDAWLSFQVETTEGVPAEPPTLSAAVPNLDAGDTIHLGKRTLRVVGKRDDQADQPPVLVVEEG
jgi:hypothetical protein